jgi:hypothetical protein
VPLESRKVNNIKEISVLSASSDEFHVSPLCAMVVRASMPAEPETSTSAIVSIDGA